MKIHELVEALVLPKINTVSTATDLQKSFDVPGEREKFGSTAQGAISLGKPDPTDPHIFHKQLKRPLPAKEHAQLLFYKAIAPINGDNPWLPVVYDVDITQDPDNVQMTKNTEQALVHTESIPLEMLWSSVMTAVHKSGINTFQMKEMIKNLRDSKSRIEKMQAADIKISEYVWQYFYNGADEIMLDIIFTALGGETTGDPMLNQASELIRMVKRKNSFYIDMHARNYMWRPTNTGYQPVITDPLIG